MEAYARKYSPAPRRSTSRKTAAEAPGASPELDVQVGRLGAQVSKVVRVVGLVQDLIYGMEARLGALEQSVTGATGLAAPGTTRSFGLGDSLREPARPDPGCSQEALQAVSEQIQGSFCELRRWQNDVEATLQKLRAEPQPPIGRGRGESPRGRANSGQPAPALKAPQAGPPVSPTSGRYIEEPPPPSFKVTDAGEPGHAEPPRLRELARRTEGTIQQLEDDLASLRTELAMAGGKGAGAKAWFAEDRAGGGVLSSGGHPDDRAGGGSAAAWRSAAKAHLGAPPAGAARPRTATVRMPEAPPLAVPSEGPSLRSSWGGAMPWSARSEERASVSRLYEELLQLEEASRGGRRPGAAHGAAEHRGGLASAGVARGPPGPVRKSASATALGRARRR